MRLLCETLLVGFLTIFLLRMKWQVRLHLWKTLVFCGVPRKSRKPLPYRPYMNGVFNRGGVVTMRSLTSGSAICRFEVLRIEVLHVLSRRQVCMTDILASRVMMPMVSVLGLVWVVLTS